MLLYDVRFLKVIAFGVAALQPKGHFVSFIMPCYNSSATLERSVESILAQDLKCPFEIICTDDGSSDNTLSILKRYAEKYENFHVYSHEANRGAGAASNTCVKHASGDLIYRLDSDNVLPLNTVARLIELLDGTGCEGASVEELKFFEGNFEAAGNWKYEVPNNISDLSHIVRDTKDPASSGNYLYTKVSYDRAGGYPEQHGHDTFCFGFKQYATGTRIAILPKSFYWHFNNFNGYNRREEKKGTLSPSVHRVMLDFIAVFAPETQLLLRNLNPRETSIFTLIRNNKLKLIKRWCNKFIAA